MPNQLDDENVPSENRFSRRDSGSHTEMCQFESKGDIDYDILVRYIRMNLYCDLLK